MKEAPKGWHYHKNGGGLVQDTAHVDESAWVYGNAQVSGDAWVKSPLYIQGSRHSATNVKHGHIAIGCEVRTYADWKKDFKSVGKKYGYTPEEIEEYGKIIDLFCAIGRQPQSGRKGGDDGEASL